MIQVDSTHSGEIESVRTNGKNARLFVRTTESELAAWKAQASREGKLFSEWVCETLNGVLDDAQGSAAKPTPRAARVQRAKDPKEPVRQKCRHGLFLLRDVFGDCGILQFMISASHVNRMRTSFGVIVQGGALEARGGAGDGTDGSFGGRRDHDVPQFAVGISRDRSGSASGNRQSSELGPDGSGRNGRGGRADVARGTPKDFAALLGASNLVASTGGGNGIGNL